jgi:hypothetical protein
MDVDHVRAVIKGILRNIDLWSERAMQEPDRDDFMVYSDAENAAITVFLHEHGEMVGLTAPDSDDGEDEATSNAHGNG